MREVVFVDLESEHVLVREHRHMPVYKHKFFFSDGLARFPQTYFDGNLSEVTAWREAIDKAILQL